MITLALGILSAGFLGLLGIAVFALVAGLFINVTCTGSRRAPRRVRVINENSGFDANDFN